MVSVEFVYDFASPNSYLCHCVIPAIEKRTGATFVYTPVLLGGIFKATGNTSPVQAFAHVKGKPEYGMLEIRRFVERYAIDFTMNPAFPVNTLMLMRGAVAAERLGLSTAYIEAMMRFMWREPRKMDDPAVLERALADADLPAAEIVAKAQEPEVKQALVDNTTAAVARGVFGAPTFFVGDAMYFGKDRLWEVEEAVVGHRLYP